MRERRGLKRVCNVLAWHGTGTYLGEQSGALERPRRMERGV